MKWTGNVWRYGDHVDTDAIIPARYLNSSDPDTLAAHCMEDIDPAFAAKVQTGDLLVAGENFGCGSSREHAPLAIKACGISCVIASSFARIFYRNALNIGLPIIVSPGTAESARNGNQLEVDLSIGRIANLTLDEMHRTDTFPAFILELIEAGGLVAYTRERLRACDFDRLRARAADVQGTRQEST